MGELTGIQEVHLNYRDSVAGMISVKTSRNLMSFALRFKLYMRSGSQVTSGRAAGSQF